MATYPYNPALGGLVKAIEQFRKSFPGTVDSALLKRLGIAAANESYVINTLRFIGLIDEEGNRVDDAVAYFFGSPDDFAKGMEGAVKSAYADLFAEHGENAWDVERDSLVTWFRQKDKTSDLIGRRQAGTFAALAGLGGHGEMPRVGATRETSNGGSSARPKASPRTIGPRAQDAKTSTVNPPGTTPPATPVVGVEGFGLSVRIEVNLPVDASGETYDAIFASIRKNLIERG